MLLPYSKIVGSPIIDLKTQSKLGEVSEIVIKKSDISLHGLILRGSSILSRKTNVVAASDIVEIIKGAVVVSDIDSVVDFDEAIRLKEAFLKGFHGIGQKVVTKNGKTIGKVFDYLVQSDTNLIVKFYVKNLLSEKIIGRNSVISFEKNKIVIKDDFEEIRIAAAVVESSLV